MDLDDTITRLARDPGLDVDLAEVALRLAADEYPDLDVTAYLARLDALADTLAPRLVGSLEGRVAELSNFLFEERGFTGNATDYYNPRNSYFNDVLDCQLGIPLTLSLVAMAVGRRCGLDIRGVGLPGHFIAKAVGPGDEVYFDPFHGGQFLDRDACSLLVTTVTGQPYTVTDDALAPAPPGWLVLRMLTNLKGIYLRAADFPRAARTVARLAQLMPRDWSQRRDLGVCLVHANRPGAAIDHLKAYLSAAPDAEDTEAVTGFLREARKHVAKWN